MIKLKKYQLFILLFHALVGTQATALNFSNVCHAKIAKNWSLVAAGAIATVAGIYLCLRKYFHNKEQTSLKEASFECKSLPIKLAEQIAQLTSTAEVISTSPGKTSAKIKNDAEQPLIFSIFDDQNEKKYSAVISDHHYAVIKNKFQTSWEL